GARAFGARDHSGRRRPLPCRGHRRPGRTRGCRLKYGLVSTLTERLERAPSVREIIPVGGARYRAEDIAALAARADVA
ncbi:hypothetical protein ACLXBB_37125, partial [Pseudomonas aeruginosa]